MASDPFLDALAADLRPVIRRSWIRDFAWLMLLVGIELGLFLALGMGRSDMATAMHAPAFWWKMATMGVIAAASSVIALRSFAPPAKPSKALRGLTVLILFMVGLGFVILGGAGRFYDRIDWHYGVSCTSVIAVLSVPFVVAFGVFMRRGAAVRPGLSALAAGIAGAAWAALIFAFHCRSDDPLYVTVWYTAGFGAATLLARLALPMAARW